jgi:hypothetical protein
MRRKGADPKQIPVHGGLRWPKSEALPEDTAYPRQSAVPGLCAFDGCAGGDIQVRGIDPQAFAERTISNSEHDGRFVFVPKDGIARDSFANVRENDLERPQASDRPSINRL